MMSYDFIQVSFLKTNNRLRPPSSVITYGRKYVLLQLDVEQLILDFDYRPLQIAHFPHYEGW